MSRIVTQDEAREVIDNGNADLKVMSAMSSEAAHGTFYTVLVPLSTMRDGFFGPFNKVVGGNGTPTKFGADLFEALLGTEGIEPSLNRGFRDGITIFVKSDFTEKPAEGFLHQSRGLPASVCYTIQEQIMRHNTRSGRVLEYLRHLI
jgi:hypothetical protein